VNSLAFLADSGKESSRFCAVGALGIEKHILEPLPQTIPTAAPPL
jgi:hypothetical protein